VNMSCGTRHPDLKWWWRACFLKGRERFKWCGDLRERMVDRSVLEAVASA